MKEVLSLLCLVHDPFCSFASREAIGHYRSITMCACRLLCLCLIRQFVVYLFLSWFPLLMLIFQLLFMLDCPSLFHFLFFFADLSLPCFFLLVSLFLCWSFRMLLPDTKIDNVDADDDHPSLIVFPVLATVKWLRNKENNASESVAPEILGHSEYEQESITHRCEWTCWEEQCQLKMRINNDVAANSKKAVKILLAMNKDKKWRLEWGNQEGRKGSEETRKREAEQRGNNQEKQGKQQ